MSPRTDAIRAGDGSRLLGHLPAGERRTFTERCTTVELEFGQVLTEPAERVRYVYFPIAATISLNAPAGVGSRLEVALIGNEGLLRGNRGPGRRGAPAGARATPRECATLVSRCVSNRAVAVAGASRDDRALRLHSASPDRTDGGLHPLPPAGGAARKVAVDDAGPCRRLRVPADPSLPRSNAGSAPRRRDNGRPRCSRAE